MKTHTRRYGYVVIVIALALLTVTPLWAQQKYEVVSKKVVEHKGYFELLTMGYCFPEQGVHFVYAKRTCRFPSTGIYAAFVDGLCQAVMGQY